MEEGRISTRPSGRLKTIMATSVSCSIMRFDVVIFGSGSGGSSGAMQKIGRLSNKYLRGIGLYICMVPTLTYMC